MIQMVGNGIVTVTRSSDSKMILTTLWKNSIVTLTAAKVVDCKASCILVNWCFKNHAHSVAFLEFCIVFSFDGVVIKKCGFATAVWWLLLIFDVLFS